MRQVTNMFKRARGDVALTQAEARLAARLDEFARQLRAIEQAVASLRDQVHATSHPLAPATVRQAPIALRTDSGAWKERAQEGELAFHKKPNIRSGDNWESDTHRKWTQFGFNQHEWNDKLIVDVGAGSRLRTKWFAGARIAAIEPLGDRFIREVEWEDLSDADELYAVPAERLIPELVNRADLVVSINALDHGYDFGGAIENIQRYMKPDALAFLSFDQHEVPDSMHPLVLDEQITRRVLERAGLEVTRFEEAGRYHGGPGLLALNYWLRRTA